MIEAYREAVAFLESLPTLEPARPRDRGGAHSGDRAQDLLSRLGHPEVGPRIIHIGGTSGKGSTVHMLHHMYAAAGYPVLSFTSPHLTTTLERFSFGAGLLPMEVFVEAVEELRPAIDAAHIEGRWGAPGYFDALFAVCMLAAKAVGADPVILEVGLGGTLDATNQIPCPLAAAITDVGLDHTQILGDTVEIIAQDKAGIYKTGASLLSGATLPSVRALLEQRANALDEPLQLIDRDFSIEERDGQRRFVGPTGSLSLPGASSWPAFKCRNAALALAIAMSCRARDLPIEDAHLEQGLQTVAISGRFERVPGVCEVVLDVAHNPDKMRAFVSAFVREYGPNHATLVAVAADKDLGGVLQALAGGFKTVIATRSLNPFRKFVPPRELAQAARAHVAHVEVACDPHRGLLRALALEGRGGVVAVTGSTFLVGELRSRWQSERQILERGALLPVSQG